MKRSDVNYLIGGDVNTCSLPPYNEIGINFLSELSVKLMKFRTYSDVVSLAYFCRKANLLRLKETFCDGQLRLGRGTVFHIAPSNVPINFAFSFVFGILAGCSNIVRVPSKEFEQVSVVCDCIAEILQKPEYEKLKRGTAVVRYPRSDEITEYFSSLAACRIIWGGDETVNSVRQSACNPKCVDISFADRYSFMVVDAQDVLLADDAQLRALAKDFYNDTYYIDQNACSSPHLIVWTGQGKAEAKELFWNYVAKTAEDYELEPIKAVDKYTQLLTQAVRLNCIDGVKKYGNRVYRAHLKHLPKPLYDLRGKFGLFYEYDCDRLDELKDFITDKFQTVTYYGNISEAITSLVMQNGLSGIDRIVPVGQALSMDVIWDGYDIVQSLSRIIRIQKGLK